MKRKLFLRYSLSVLILGFAVVTLSSCNLFSDNTCDCNSVCQTPSNSSSEAPITSGNKSDHSSEEESSSIDPFDGYVKIKTADQLKNIKDNNYVLLNDIDLSGEEWTPILSFNGILDGNGYKISGLSITNGSDNSAFIGENNGEIKNISLSGKIEFSTEYNRIGLLCGTNNGIISNVYAEGLISTPYSNNVGGIVGVNYNSNVSNCESNVEVIGYNYVGGVMGYTQLKSKNTLKYNINRGDVTGYDYVGGVVGEIQGSKPSSNNHIYSYASELENYGNVSANNMASGGIVGYYFSNEYYDYYNYLEITNCKNYGVVSSDKYTGGIIGYSKQLSYLSACENNGDISGKQYVGGYVGYCPNASLKGLKNSNKISADAYVGGIAGYSGYFSNCENNGDIVSTVPIVVDNVLYSYLGGIAGYARSINNCINNVDINLTTNGRNVGGIAGYVYVSNNAKLNENINNGDITNQANATGGLFGRIHGVKPSSNSNTYSTISGNVNNGKISSSGNWIGGIVGVQSSDEYYDYFNYLEFVNCENNGEIHGNNYVGGIIGSANYVNTISSCVNNADIYGNYSVGGFAGYGGNADFVNLSNKNKITGNVYVGGICGNDGRFTNCKNEGKIEIVGTYTADGNIIGYIGGIAGYATYIKDCINTSNIENLLDKKNYVGGIVGYLYVSNNNTVEGNVNEGYISVNGNYVGGIVGYLYTDITSTNAKSTTFRDNSNSGNILALGNYVGGIIGIHNTRLYYSYPNVITISNSSNTGNISGDNYVAGLLGYSSNYNINNDIWNTNVSTGVIDGIDHTGIYIGV